MGYACRHVDPVPYCLPLRLTPSAHALVLAISELINFRDTQPACAPSQSFKGSFCVATFAHQAALDIVDAAFFARFASRRRISAFDINA